MLSTDKSAFRSDSEVRRRFVEYGSLCDELHIVVVTPPGHREEAIAENVYLHPTNTASRLSSFLVTLRIGKSLPPPDLVTAQDPFEVGLLGYFVARAHGARLELQVHTDLLSPHFARPSFKNRLRVFVGKWLLPKADGIRVVSERVKRSLEASKLKLKSAPSVLSIWSDPERLFTGNAIPLRSKYDFDFVAVTAARLEPEKDLPTLLQAFKKVVAEYPRVGLVILGEGSERAKLERLAARLGIKKNVVFHGWTIDTAAHYRGADLYLSASKYEGYGLSLAEAALAGAPIVSTNAGIAGDILVNDESALVVPVGDARALARAVIRLMGDAELRKKLARAARARVLKALPKDKQEYLVRYRATWEAALTRRKKKALFITQKMDLDDTVLGFFHQWVAAFAPHYAGVTVVCLEKGRTELDNIPVYSLGKEIRPSRLRYLFNFYRYIWRFRRDYDAVFVHMNQEYVLLGAFLWKLLGKRIVMWRNHYEGGITTRLAVLLSDAVFCTSRYSFTARFKKTKLMPVGVDTDLFKRIPSVVRGEGSILSLSRLAPSKNLGLIVEALIALSRRDVPFVASFYGEAQPDDQEYEAYLKDEVKKFGLEAVISFAGGVKQREAPAVYGAYEIFVNAARSGMYDKTIFEAMSAETLVLVSNKDLALRIHQRFIFKESDAIDLAEKLEALLSLPQEEKERYGRELREFVEKHHSLELLAKRLAEAI